MPEFLTDLHKMGVGWGCVYVCVWLVIFGVIDVSDQQIINSYKYSDS